MKCGGKRDVDRQLGLLERKQGVGGLGGSRWLAGIFQRQGCIIATVMVF